MSDHDERYERTGSDNMDEPRDDESHASTGGSAVAGAATGGAIGAVGAGPIGAAVGAVGGAIVGAVSERVMHAGDNDDRTEYTGTTTTTGYTEDTPRMATRDHDMDRDSTRSVELREEELQARKHMVDRGDVEIRKDVVTENRTVEVPVTREEVYIDRHPADRHVSDRPIEHDETISVPVREEEVTIEKRPVVREEVTIGKHTVQDTEQVSGTVRREEAHLEEHGDVHVHDDDSTRGTQRPGI